MFWPVLGYFLVFTVVFWAVVFCCYWRRLLRGNPFRAAMTLDAARAAHTPQRLARELLILQADLVTQSRPGRRNGRRVSSPLDEGIAVNTTAIQADENPANVDNGDMWFSDGRPFLMAVIQTILTLPTSYLLVHNFAPEMTEQNIADGSYATWVGWSTFAVWSFWTGLMFLFGYRTVQQNFRLGVYRFGVQLHGFLEPGLQFVIPLIERAQPVSLQVAEWAAHDSEEDLGEEFHLPGTAGEGNPRPGVFQVSFLGAWPLEIAIGVILSVAKSDRAAWDWYLNHYAALKQVGEAMARYILGVVTTWAREEPWNLLNSGRYPEHQGKTKKQILDDPFAVMDVYHALLDQLPEVVANVLERLHGIGRQDLGGFLIRRVVQSTIKPGEKYQALLQSAQQAEVQRYIAMRLGQAAADRWKGFLAFAATVPAEHQALLVTMAQKELDRVLYQNVGPEGAGVFNAFLADLMSAEQNALRKRPQGQATAPPPPAGGPTPTPTPPTP